MGQIQTALKWHGGKAHLATRIVALMPPHLHYVEPFAGGLSVLLAKDPDDVSEVVNDLNEELTNFWAVLKDEPQFALFSRRVQATAFSELDYVSAEVMGEIPPVDRWLRAWGFFVRCRQSLAGRMKAFAPLSRTRVRRGMNEQASAWLSAVEGLPAVHARLKRVVVLNRDAVDVIRQQDGPRTLFYLDPPYTHDSRAAADVYTHEMTAADHQRLLDAVTDPGLTGKVMLSGYDNPLYAARLASWTRHTFDVANNAAGGSSKRVMTEVLWCNF